MIASSWAERRKSDPGVLVYSSDEIFAVSEAAIPATYHFSFPSFIFLDFPSHVPAECLRFSSYGQRLRQSKLLPHKTLAYSRRRAPS